MCSPTSGIPRILTSGASRAGDRKVTFAELRCKVLSKATSTEFVPASVHYCDIVHRILLHAHDAVEMLLLGECVDKGRIASLFFLQAERKRSVVSSNLVLESLCFESAVVVPFYVSVVKPTIRLLGATRAGRNWGRAPCMVRPDRGHSEIVAHERNIIILINGRKPCWGWSWD